jgi:hypothetical protein
LFLPRMCCFEIQARPQGVGGPAGCRRAGRAQAGKRSCTSYVLSRHGTTSAKWGVRIRHIEIMIAYCSYCAYYFVHIVHIHIKQCICSESEQHIGLFGHIV